MLYIVKMDGQAPVGTSVPTGVKIISVLYYIGAGFGILFGILFFVGAGFLGAVASQIPLLGAFGKSLFIVVGIILIGLSVLSIFVGRGLWKGKNWARIVAIIFAALGAIMAIVSIVGGSIANGISSLAVQLLIGGYLLLNSSVKSAFSS